MKNPLCCTTGMVTATLFLVATILFFVARFFLKRHYSYWQRLGIKSVRTSFPFGSVSQMFLGKGQINDILCDFYKEGEGEKYIGCHIVMKPVLIVRDLELIKQILVKDFAKFVNRGTYYDEEVDPCSGHLFSIDGEKWKVLRQKLSPTFTSGKIKIMYKAMMHCNQQMMDFVEEELKTKDTLNMTKVIKHLMLNVIASTAFAIEGGGMQEENEFSRMVFMFHDLTFVQMMRVSLPLICKELAKLLRMRILPKVASDYFYSIVEEIVIYREKTKTRREDFMQLMIDLNNSTDEKDLLSDGGKPLTMNDMVAQAFVFIVAGYETTSSIMSFLLYELAKNQDIQERLIKEIDDAGDKLEDVSYEKLVELKYMDMVLDEALRKHPPVGFLQRINEEEFVLPGGKTLEAGTLVFIPVKGLHWDPQYFPDPEKFNPERFNKERTEQSIEPFTNLPFGEGPRFCIGKRFAKIQTKMALFSVLSKYRLEISQTTIDPPVVEPKAFTQQPLDGKMELRLVKRK